MTRAQHLAQAARRVRERDLRLRAERASRDTRMIESGEAVREHDTITTTPIHLKRHHRNPAVNLTTLAPPRETRDGCSFVRWMATLSYTRRLPQRIHTARLATRGRAKTARAKRARECSTTRARERRTQH